MSMFIRHIPVWLWPAAFWPIFSAAQTPTIHDEIVVTATRQPVAGLTAPAAIDRVQVDVIRAGLPLVDLSEVLNRVPGVVVQNRQNFAQDTQISARGFGARASFGIRGIKLFVDGIPASIPDGQGQGAIIPLFTVENVEVLRGPWAVPFGNAAGGVISASSIAPGGKAQFESGATFAQYNTRVTSMAAGSASDRVAGRVAAQQLSSDGFRAHSQVQREQTYARLDLDLVAGHRLMLTGNLIHQPDTGDPLGLTKAQLDADPRQATQAAINFNTSKSIYHQQIGAVYDGNAGMLTWRAMAYGGNRDIEQFLSTPVATQAAAASPGGVVALERNFHGVGLRLSALQAAWTWTLGADWDVAEESRKGYENFIRNGADTALGVRGRLRRDEINTQRAFDVFAYLDLAIDDKWKAHAALRSNRISFASSDRYITADNGDDSGARRYQRNTAALALTHRLNPASSLYVSASSGFETPTAAELAYRADRTAGLNFGLAASSNAQVELGFKQRRDRIAINIAAFVIRSNDEIVPATSAAGRTTFQNGGRTLRRGLESSADWNPDASADVMPNVNFRLAYTFLDAMFREGYQVPDVADRTVAPGAVLPAVPRHQFYAEAAWRRGLAGLSAAMEWQARTRVSTDDVNSAFAAGYGVVNARAVYRFSWGAAELTPFVRLENLFDKKYVGSVIVNEANQRYFESAPTRHWMAGISGVVRF